MKEKYYLFDILETEKNMVVNMSIALNESSNDYLYKEFFKMFDSISKETKELYKIGYNKGWYTTEDAEKNKIVKEIKKLCKDLNAC